jgi:hypothetical protein
MCLFQKIERREKFDHAVRERERQRIEEYQRKWSHREEADFFRTVSTFGVEFDRLVICVFCSKLLSSHMLYVDSGTNYRFFFFFSMYYSSVTMSHEEFLVTPDLSCRAYL